MQDMKLSTSAARWQHRVQQRHLSGGLHRPIASPARRFWLTFALGFALNCGAAPACAPSLTGSGPEVLTHTSPQVIPLIEPTPRRNWSVQASVAVISQISVEDIFTEGIEPAQGDARGLLYSLGLNWTAHRFSIPFRERRLTPQFEPYVRLTLVDQNSSSLFPDYNGGVGFRWVDFPWNRWLETTFFMGIGLSYSSQVYTVDRERHPGEERSHLKFDWPIQFTFALPRWRRHQLVLFVDHQSGGHIFDEGGVNSYGIGYRFEF